MAKYEREQWQGEARQRRSEKKGGEEMKERKKKGGELKMPLNRDLNLTLHYDHTPRESPIRIGTQNQAPQVVAGITWEATLRKVRQVYKKKQALKSVIR